MVRADLTRARGIAESTFADQVALGWPGDDTFDRDQGGRVPGEPTVDWVGSGSLSAPGGAAAVHTGGHAGNDQVRSMRVLRLPVDAPATVGQHAWVGVDVDDVTGDPILDGHEPVVIAELLGRTNRVVQRVRVVSLADSQQVPG